MSPSQAKTKRPPFDCQRCNDCCQGRGGIFFETEEIPAAAAILLDMSAEEFTQAFLAPREGRWEVLCNDDGACRLLGPQGCRVHQAKPAICQLWPFFPGILAKRTAFEDARQACPGINPDISHEQFVAYARELGYTEDEPS
ncbi:MAG: YkgJ family cysteine cluster protein [Desulfarculaceae bacterium]|nr:YkgJ family cysteine cluster protein [Desulfarculaceae bacterium]MCF8071091.1 YkgJ family cysteine cluster protein [Desulfarculaceae bacterium]MCF8100679.1 YkgJ family cysteine cluster protein [Desulfarculaceae bacterium]MCF8118077.1 YkgJ family cysteine cluster protein [Desulfarculaceae bacterium]